VNIVDYTECRVVQPLLIFFALGSQQFIRSLTAGWSPGCAVAACGGGGGGP